MKPTWALEDIADAIRERGSLPATRFSVSGFAPRIRAFVAGGANADARRVFHFLNFLTPAEEQAQNLVRCDGRPLYEATDPVLHTFFKGGWQSGRIPVSPSRTYAACRLVGNKLYVGSTTSLTTILVIDTLTGAVKQITGLPSRAYTRFELIGTKIYCQHPAASMSSFNSIVCIDTANDTFKLISLVSAEWNGFLLIGNRLFIGCRSWVTYLAYIDITTETVSYVNGVTTGARGQHLIPAGTKIYISTPTGTAYTDYLAVVDTTRIDTGNAVLPRIEGLPNRYHDASYMAGTRWLYVSSTVASDSIIRIDTQTDSVDIITGLPSRKYAVEIARHTNAFTGKLVGNKLYVGCDFNLATTIVVINNTNGQWAEITGLPNSQYPFFDDAPASFSNWNTNWSFEASGNILQQRMHTAGTKLYLTRSQSANTLVILETNAAWPPTDTFKQITGLASRVYNRLFLNGTTLYLLSSTAAANIEMINLNDDTRLTPLAGLTSRAYGVPMVTGGRLYLGNDGAATNLPIINLANNTLVEDVVGLESRAYSILVLMHGKIYVGDASTYPATYATLLVLTDAVLPNHPQPVYIRPG